MKKRVFYPKNDTQFDHMVEYLAEKSFKPSYMVTVQDASGKRTLAQNALFHAWCGDIAEQKGDQSELEVKNEVKLLFGIPMMVAEQPDDCECYGPLLRMSYSDKLVSMPGFMVTSKMNVGTFAKLLHEMEVHYSREGVYLTRRQDMYHEALYGRQP